MTRKPKTALSRSHEAATVESFRKDPQFAADYLTAVRTGGDQQEVMVALPRLSKAFGGVTKIAKAAELNATTLYRTLSPNGNPELKSLTSLLRAMGMRLAVMPCHRNARPNRLVRICIPKSNFRVHTVRAERRESAVEA